MGLPLFFARGFSAPGGLTGCSRQNVVLHARMRPCPFRGSMRPHLGTHRPAVIFPEHFSSACPDSQFRHCRYNLGDSGKILAFRSKKNLIRAGKHTHADALVSCLLFLRWSGTTAWPARLNAPNMVVSGTLAAQPTAALKTHPRATWSAKFPGVAVKLPSGTTTEIYASGAFIVPGITSAGQLATALRELVEAAA